MKSGFEKIIFSANLLLAIIFSFSTNWEILGHLEKM
jgi:hypothetical protein